MNHRLQTPALEPPQPLYGHSNCLDLRYSKRRTGNEVKGVKWYLVNVAAEQETNYGCVCVCVYHVCTSVQLWACPTFQ